VAREPPYSKAKAALNPTSDLKQKPFDIKSLWSNAETLARPKKPSHICLAQAAEGCARVFGPAKRRTARMSLN